MYNFYDTSSLLLKANTLFEDPAEKIVISSITLKELEEIKTMYNKTSDHPAPRRQVSPRPCRAPGGFPAILATPGSTTGTDPHPKPSESRHPQPGFTQSRVRSRRVFSLSVHLREHNWEARPHPRQKPTPAPRRPCLPRPCTV